MTATNIIGTLDNLPMVQTGHFADVAITWLWLGKSVTMNKRSLVDKHINWKMLFQCNTSVLQLTGTL